MRVRRRSREEILAPYALLPLAVLTWYVDLGLTALAWLFVARVLWERVRADLDRNLI